jgi:hypothetical protein
VKRTLHRLCSKAKDGQHVLLLEIELLLPGTGLAAQPGCHEVSKV